MAVVKGYLVIDTTVPVALAAPGPAVAAYPFTSFDGEDLLTAAQRVADAMSLPGGSKAQVFDMASATQYVLKSRWVAA